MCKDSREFWICSFGNEILPEPSVVSQQVRETETWMPMSTTQTVAMSTDGGDLEASGDSSNGSDFGFTDDEDDNYDEDDMSGSGEGGRFWFLETKRSLSSAWI